MVDYALPADRRHGPRAAFSLVELLAVIAIIGVLTGLLLPALQASREAARRAQCLGKLAQLTLAAQNYQSAHGHFPAGAVSRANPADPATPHTFYRWSAIAAMLPYMEALAEHAQLNLELPMYGSDYAVPVENRAGVQTLLPGLLCPSDRGERVSPAYGPTNYAACSGRGAGGGTPFDAEGVFYINSAVRPADILDGTTHTVLFAECLLGESPPPLTPRSAVDPRLVYAFATATPLNSTSCNNSSLWNFTDPPSFSWANGEHRSAMYNHIRTPNSQEIDCVAAALIGPLTHRFAAYGWRTARSNHPGGVNASLAGGSGRFVVDGIDLAAWQALATRAGEDE